MESKKEQALKLAEKIYSESNDGNREAELVWGPSESELLQEKLAEMASDKDEAAGLYDYAVKSLAPRYAR